MKLTTSLQEHSGLRWVLDQMEPLSPFGRSAMRALTWYAPGNEFLLEQELENVERGILLWEKSSSALRTMTRCLSQFRDIQRSLDRHNENPFDLVELFELKHFLLVFQQFTESYHLLPPFIGIDFTSMTEVLNLLDPSGRRLPSFSVEDAYHPDLAQLRQQKRKIDDSIRNADTNQCPALLDQHRLLSIREKQIELEVRTELTQQILGLKHEFLSNIENLGRADLIFAKAKLARKYQCVRPTVATDGKIRLHALTHPKIAAELDGRGETFTPVDIELGSGCTVITGANMGGKTVSLQAVTLSVILFQCGFFLFAREAQLPLFDLAELILADSGPGSGGLSSFGAEVHALDSFLRRCDGKLFFLALDEFARGTNPQEGAALAKSLVSHLNTQSCIALITTHYDGVSSAAAAHYQVAGLTEEIYGDEHDDPRSRIARRMDYRLLPALPGAPCPKDALKVCRLLALDENLLALFEGNS